MEQMGVSLTYRSMLLGSWVQFDVRQLAEGVEAWRDRDYVYVDNKIERFHDGREDV